MNRELTVFQNDLLGQIGFLRIFLIVLLDTADIQTLRIIYLQQRFGQIVSL